MDLQGLLGLRPTGGRARGTVVHAWLETLEWIEDGLAPAAELRRIALNAGSGLGADEVEELLAWLRDRLEQPEIRRVLSREAWPEGAAVERELPFLLREGDALVEGVVDRLVLVRDGEGRTTGAEVLDYKTDAAGSDGPATIEKLVALYAPQLRSYREAVASLYGLDPEAVAGRLVFLEPGIVRAAGGP